MIAVDDLTVVLGGRAVLRGVNFALEPGAFVGLIGPPSVGKSVLLKVIAGLVEPARGRVRIDDAELSALGPAERRVVQSRIGMVFQNNALFDSKTIFENVAFPLRRAPQPPAEDEIRQRVTRRLTDVGLARAVDLFPHELSGGMQKRAGIARATVFSPETCLYDEPTAGLDPVTSARILSLIATLHAEKGSAVSIVVSNEMDTLLKFAPRVIMLDEGEIIFDGPASAISQGQAPRRVCQFVRGESDEGH